MGPARLNLRPLSLEGVVPPVLGPTLHLWPNMALFSTFSETNHGQQDRHRSRSQAHPRPQTPNGVTLGTPGRGQRVSLERGVATRSKKNPGKRSKKGG